MKLLQAIKKAIKWLLAPILNPFINRIANRTVECLKESISNGHIQLSQQQQLSQNSLVICSARTDYDPDLGELLNYDLNDSHITIGDRNKSNIKFGVIYFSYNGMPGLCKDGVVAVNIGDYMQSLAARNIYSKLGIQDQELVTIDRDSLSQYSGPPAIMIFSGIFGHHSFPIPDTIIPIFMGFHADASVIAKNINYFRRFQPIGCRDSYTAHWLKEHGVAAYVTGCLTMAFDRRKHSSEEDNVFIAYGENEGEFPCEAIKLMPPHLLEKAIFISQRRAVHTYPISEYDMRASEMHAEYIFSQYKNKASLLITSLHHAAAPCIALGIPVIVCRKSWCERFSFMKNILPIHTRPFFHNIQWSPSAIDLGTHRQAIIIEASKKIKDALEKL